MKFSTEHYDIRVTIETVDNDLNIIDLKDRLLKPMLLAMGYGAENVDALFGDSEDEYDVELDDDGLYGEEPEPGPVVPPKEETPVDALNRLANERDEAEREAEREVDRDPGGRGFAVNLDRLLALNTPRIIAEGGRTGPLNGTYRRCSPFNPDGRCAACRAQETLDKIEAGSEETDIP